MRILIDECLDERFRQDFLGYDCQTARYAGFAGLKNGKLLSAAEAAGFNVIVTVDRNMPRQQDMRTRSISIIVLAVPTNRLVHLRYSFKRVLRALAVIKPGEVILVPFRDA